MNKRETKAALAALVEKHEDVLSRLTERLADLMLGEKLPLDIFDAETGMPIIPCNRKITKVLLYKVARRWNYIEIDPSPIRNKVLEIIYKFDDELLAAEGNIRKFNESL